MIVFDLRCTGAGHVFEAWFGSSEDYESQRGRGLVSCPICGDLEIGKAPSAPRIAGTGEPPSAAEAKAMLARLARMQGALLATSEDVGGRFAEEVRAIHGGESDDRRIHGRASPAEARALIADGIPITPLPLPVVADTAKN